MDSDKIDKVQEKYLQQKYMDEQYVQTFRHMARYYDAWEIFVKSGVSYEQLLEVKLKYENQFFNELAQLMSKPLMDREWGEPVDFTSVFEYLRMPYKTLSVFKTKIKNKSLPLDHCREMISWITDNCTRND